MFISWWFTDMLETFITVKLLFDETKKCTLNFISYLTTLRGLVVGVVCLEEGVRVPSSCSLSVSMAE